MSKIPDTPKTKYNHNDPFRWVDSQWEKYMTEQKELKARIVELEEQLESLVARVPSHYLTKNKIDYPDEWIYESPDGGKTTYRRKFGDYDNKELVDGKE